MLTHVEAWNVNSLPINSYSVPHQAFLWSKFMCLLLKIRIVCIFHLTCFFLRFDQFNSRYLRKILVRQDKQPKSSLVRLYQKLQRRDQIREEERKVEECVTWVTNYNKRRHTHTQIDMHTRVRHTYIVTLVYGDFVSVQIYSHWITSSIFCLCVCMRQGEFTEPGSAAWGDGQHQTDPHHQPAQLQPKGVCHPTECQLSKPTFTTVHHSLLLIHGQLLCCSAISHS